MTSTVTLTEISLQGIVPAPHEAVAIVLALFENAPSSEDVQRTHGAALPSPSSISLSPDGEVSCSHAIRFLTAAEIATLLQQVLDDTPGVPPGLLFSIARALAAVEAPPFESPQAFLRALTRFERGNRRDVLRALAERVDEGGSIEHSAAKGDRRKLPSVVTQLRQELRTMDRRGYEEQKAAPAPWRATWSATWSERDVLMHEVAPFVLTASIAAALACVPLLDTFEIDVPRVVAPPIAVAATPDYTAASADVSAFVAPHVTGVERVSGVEEVSSVRRVSRPTVRRSSRNRLVKKQPSKLRSALTFQWLRHFITIKNDL